MRAGIRCADQDIRAAQDFTHSVDIAAVVGIPEHCPKIFLKCQIEEGIEFEPEAGAGAVGPPRDGQVVDGTGCQHVKCAVEVRPLQVCIEGQDVDERAWNKLRPMLMSPGRAGLGLIEGIPPNSPGHWFARWFKRAHEHPNKLQAGFKWTYLDNPMLSQEQVEEIQEDKSVMLEEDWERLYMAIQPQGEGAFFRKVDVAARGEELLNPIQGRHYVAGLDLGRSNDPTVLVIKDRQSRASVSAVELHGGPFRRATAVRPTARGSTPDTVAT